MKHTPHARERNGREETLEVHIQDDLPADMGGRVSKNAPLADEAVCRWLNWKLVEDCLQNPILGGFQLAMRSAKHSPTAAPLGDSEVNIVCAGCDFAMKCQPSQLRHA